MLNINYTEIYLKELSGVVVSRLDYCAGDPELTQAGAEFPMHIQFWVFT